MGLSFCRLARSAGFLCKMEVSRLQQKPSGCSILGGRFLCVCVYGWVKLGNYLVVVLIIAALFLEFAGSIRDRGACGNAGNLAN